MWKRKVARAGMVLEIGEKSVRLKLFSKELPSFCAAKGCTACQSYSAEVVRDYPKNNFVNEVGVGDIVRVESWQINDGLAATAIFMVPLLFSAVFYHIAVVAGVSQESIWSVSVAVLGAILGFFVAALFDKIFGIKNPTKIFKE